MKVHGRKSVRVREVYTNILICKNNIENIFTAIYEAYEKHLNHSETYLQIGEDENIRLFSEYYIVETDEEKAKKVARTIGVKFGARSEESIWQALCADDEEKAQAVYQMLVIGFSKQIKGSLIDCLNDPWIVKVNQLCKRVGNEEHHYRGFLRFEELEGGILYANINPKSDILIQLGTHFMNRFPGEKFMIFDEKRGKYFVHVKSKKFTIMDKVVLDGWQQPRRTIEEESIQNLFRIFHKCISIDERENLTLQRSLLPFRFRDKMTEFEGMNFMN